MMLIAPVISTKENKRLVLQKMNKRLVLQKRTKG